MTISILSLFPFWTCNRAIQSQLGVVVLAIKILMQQDMKIVDTHNTWNDENMSDE